MTSTTQTKPWWRNAPNPQCADFCTEARKADEFTHGGGFSCLTPVGKSSEYFTVEIQQYAAVAEDGPEGAISRDPVAVRFELSASGDDLDEMTPELAREVSLDFSSAPWEAAHRAEVPMCRSGCRGGCSTR